MVWDPPKQQVNVTRMIIYSFIPILSIYAGWRIQKFWLLVVINFIVGAVVNPISIAIPFPANVIIALAIQIPITIFVVRYFARKYNERIAASSPPPPANP
jgi:hypothetical protein